jgi:hypothetical protein
VVSGWTVTTSPSDMAILPLMRQTRHSKSNTDYNFIFVSVDLCFQVNTFFKWRPNESDLRRIGAILPIQRKSLVRTSAFFRCFVSFLLLQCCSQCSAAHLPTHSLTHSLAVCGVVTERWTMTVGVVECWRRSWCQQLQDPTQTAS